MDQIEPLTPITDDTIKQTLDHLLEAEGSMRAAIKSAAINEKPVVVKQFAEIL